MGCFGGGKKQVATQIPDAPQFLSGEAGTRQGFDLARELFPFTLGAREGQAEAFSTPERAEEFFGGFGPTSVEEAASSELGRQLERQLRQRLSLSGLAHSPALAQLGSQKDIGLAQMLQQLGQQRAFGVAEANLGIDPQNVLRPITNDIFSQDQLQGQSNFNVDLLRAQEASRVQNFNNIQANKKAAGIKTLLGTAAGALGGGFLLAPALASAGVGSAAAGAGFGLGGSGGFLGFASPGLLGTLGGAALGGGIGSSLGGGSQPAPLNLGGAFDINQFLADQRRGRSQETLF